VHVASLPGGFREHLHEALAQALVGVGDHVSLPMSN
jgi:hypothetical protein